LGEGDGGAGFFFGGAFLVGFFVAVTFAVGVGLTFNVGLTVGVGFTVGVGLGDSVTAKLCDGRIERASEIANTSFFIDHSI
jgi:hypothetical protein